MSLREKVKMNGTRNGRVWYKEATKGNNSESVEVTEEHDHDIEKL